MPKLHEGAEGELNTVMRPANASVAARLVDGGGAMLRESVENLDVRPEAVHLVLRHRHRGRAISREPEPSVFVASCRLRLRPCDGLREC